MRNVLDENCGEKKNAHSVFNNVFPGNHAVCEFVWKKYGRIGQAAKICNTAHALRLLDN
jgi:hypothetical protein